MQLAFIGGGNMSEAILNGVLSGKLFSARDITVTDILADRLQYLQKKYRVQTNLNNLQVLKNADVVLLAVKPQVVASVLAEIKAVNNTAQLLISIVAGLPLGRLDCGGQFRAARVMPNTPALIGRAVSAVCFNDRALEQDKKFTIELLQSIGTAVEVEEKDMNAVTGLSGSGPAFVFRLLDYFMQAGEQLGLSAAQARTLVCQTFAGSAELAAQSSKTLEELITQVTSPNGTTQAGRQVLEQSAVRQVITDTILRAKERADELAKGEAKK